MISEKYVYFPTLNTKAAELVGLSKVSGETIEKVWPIFELSRHGHQKTNEAVREKMIDRISASGYFIGVPSNRALRTLDADELFDPSNNYQTWRQYVGSFDKAKPLLLNDPDAGLRDVVQQARSLSDEFEIFGMRIETDSDLNKAQSVLAGLDRPECFYPILDMGVISCSEQPITAYAKLTQWINSLRGEYEGLDIITQSTSFPRSLGNFGDSHGEIPNRDRELYEMLGGDLIARFGDHGSIHNAPFQQAARGFVPRIDVCAPYSWEYTRYRSSDGGYERCAQEAKLLESWDEELDNWATQKIREMAAGELEKYGSPAKWIAVRVCFHTEVQVASLISSKDTELGDDLEDFSFEEDFS